MEKENICHFDCSIRNIRMPTNWFGTMKFHLRVTHTAQLYLIKNLFSLFSIRHPILVKKWSCRVNSKKITTAVDSISSNHFVTSFTMLQLCYSIFSLLWIFTTYPSSNCLPVAYKRYRYVYHEHSFCGCCCRIVQILFGSCMMWSFTAWP